MKRHGLVLLLSLSLGGCFNHQKDVSGYAARAQEFIRTGSLDKARIELESGLALSPIDPELNFKLAQVQDELGDLKSAIPHYVRAAEPENHLLEAQLKLIEILLDSGRYQDAATRINTTLGAFPNSLPALALRADVRAHSGQDSGARSDADAVLRGDPSNARALAVRSALALKAHDGAAALADANRGLEQHPGNVSLLAVQAAAQLALNKPNQAVEALKSIMSTDPHNVAAQSALAEIEANSGHYDSALSSFKAAVAADPNNSDMQLAFVNFLAAQKQPAEAVAVLEGLIAASPRMPLYDLVLAEFYQSRRQLNKSADVLEAAAKRLGSDPAVAQVDVALAKIDAARGRVEQAHAEVEAALKADPTNGEALLFRGILSAQEGHPSAAIADLLALVQNEPVNGRAFEALASSYMLNGQPKLAVEAMRRAADVSPGDDKRQVKLASVLQNAGDLTGAREVISRVVLRNPNSPDVWVADGELAVDRKDWSEVANALAHLRGLQGTSAAAMVLEARLDAARGDDAGAYAVAKNSIEVNPNQDAFLIAVLARAAAATGQVPQAIAFLQTEQPKLQGDALQQSWKALMGLQADAGDLEGCAHAFGQAVTLDPSNTELYVEYSYILMSKKAYDQARRVLQQGIEAGASQWQLRFMLGVIDQASGDLKAALAIFQEVAESNPPSIDAANNAASLLAELEPKNTEALEKARDRLVGYESSANPSILDTIAWLDYRLGRYAEAKQLLTKIGADKSSHPQLRFHLGAVLVASGDRSAGETLLDSVKGLDFIGADEARSLSAS